MKINNFGFILFALASRLGFESCHCYRILGVFPFNGKSHFVMFEALMKGLARKGHQVDVVSTFPQKNPIPNYTDIIKLPPVIPSLYDNMTYETGDYLRQNIINWVFTHLGNDLCAGLRYPPLQRLIKNPPTAPPYDLFVTEFAAAHCYLAIGPLLGIPTVGLMSITYSWNNRMIGNPLNLAFMHRFSLVPEKPMDFWTRLHNAVLLDVVDLYFPYVVSGPQNAILKECFGEDAPSIDTVEKNVALVLSNYHRSLQGSIPITTALIAVGGLHVQEDQSKILEKDFHAWLNESTDGFIYFTFGSMLQIETFPERVIRIFYRCFEKISPIRIAMKIAKPELLPSGMPENIRTFKWAPQLKVLQHKNVKAFITHGGLMGTQEAVYCAVPLIAIPSFGDQFENAEMIVKKKIGIALNVDDITEEILDNALRTILSDPIYKENMLKLSAEFMDRPMAVMDEAIWWVEYVARRGDRDIRSPALDLYWWQVDLLDVYATILIIIVLLLFLITISIRWILKKLFIVAKHSEAVTS